MTKQPSCILEVALLQHMRLNYVCSVSFKYQLGFFYNSSREINEHKLDNWDIWAKFLTFEISSETQLTIEGFLLKRKEGSSKCLQLLLTKPHWNNWDMKNIETIT